MKRPNMKDWLAAYMLRSDGIRRAYAIDTLRLVADEEEAHDETQV